MHSFAGKSVVGTKLTWLRSWAMSLPGAKQTSLFHLITTGRFWREAAIRIMNGYRTPSIRRCKLSVGPFV
jgi:hypothetical protein